MPKNMPVQCNIPGKTGEATSRGCLGTQKAEGEAGQGAQVSSRHLGSQVPDVRGGPAEHGGDRAGTIVDPLVPRVRQVQEADHLLRHGPGVNGTSVPVMVVRRLSSSWTRGLRL